MTSWVWNHFEKVDREIGVCNICQIAVNRCGGTSTIERHLKRYHGMPNPRESSVHSNKKPAPESENQFIGLLSESQQKPQSENVLPSIKKEPIEHDNSLIIKEVTSNHLDYVRLDTAQSSRPLRARKVFHRSNSLLSEVDSSQDSVSQTNECSSSVNSHGIDNCFVCNAKLKCCRNNISFIMKFSEAPLYEVFETFTGTIIAENDRNNCQVCHNCLVSFEKFDDLQRQASEIQSQLTQIYYQTHDEIFDTHQETEEKDFGSELLKEKTVLIAFEPEASTAKKYFCKKCNKRFEKVSYEIHCKTDHERGRGPFKCGKCSKLCNDVNSIKLHYLEHSLQDTREFMKKQNKSDESYDANKKFVCSIAGCTKRFVNSFKLRSHLKTHFCIKNYQCSINSCGKRFTERFELNAHQKHKHPGVSIIPTTSNTKSSPSKNENDSARKETRIDEPLYACHILGCSKRFITSLNLINHIRMHTGEVEEPNTQKKNKIFSAFDSDDFDPNDNQSVFLISDVVEDDMNDEYE